MKKSPSPDESKPKFERRPLKPRPILFLLCLLVTIGWIAFLVALYFKTVRGR